MLCDCAQQLAGGPDDGGEEMHPRSKATRRGPMDEMRQLVRILVKIIPHSMAYISTAEEGGGGNRISEEQIKSYLENTLGEAPRPAWGCPGGWGGYISELFTWASGRSISRKEAMRCARRDPGRSWEAIYSEMDKLGLYPGTWPLPLSIHGMAAALTNPQQQPMMAVDANGMPVAAAPPSAGGTTGGRKRSADGPVVRSDAAFKTGRAEKQRRGHQSSGRLDHLTELQLWQRALTHINVARRKSGMTPPEHTAALHVCQADLRAAVNDILREAQPQLLQPQLLSPQLLPPPAAAAGDGATAAAPQQVCDLILESMKSHIVKPHDRDRTRRQVVLSEGFLLHHVPGSDPQAFNPSQLSLNLSQHLSNIGSFGQDIGLTPSQDALLNLGPPSQPDHQGGNGASNAEPAQPDAQGRLQEGSMVSLMGGQQADGGAGNGGGSAATNGGEHLSLPGASAASAFQAVQPVQQSIQVSKPHAVRGYTHVTAAGLVLANHLGGGSMGDPPSPSQEANRQPVYRPTPLKPSDMGADGAAATSAAMAQMASAPIVVDASMLNGGASGLLNLVAIAGPNGQILLQQLPASQQSQAAQDYVTMLASAQHQQQQSQLLHAAQAADSSAAAGGSDVPNGLANAG